MFRNLILSGLATAFILLAGCTNYNEEELYGTAKEEVCVIATATFTSDVKPIMQRECYSCHTTSFASGNTILDTHAGVKSAAIDHGHLLAVINHEPGHTPMPLGAGKLPACDIAKIKKWIDLGALNN